MNRAWLVLGCLVAGACAGGGAGGTDGGGDRGPDDVAGDLGPGDLEVREMPADAGDGGLEAGDAPSEDAGDVPSGEVQGLWERLDPVGPPLATLLGVASHVDTEAAPDPLRDFEFAQYQASGLSRVRRGLRWSRVEPSQDDWHFDEVQGVVDASVASGVRLTALLAYGNPWAQEDPELYGTVRVEAYAHYAGEMAARYCREVTDYEVWNEPNITRFWHLPPDPARYADLLIQASRAIREQCPSARVFFGGLASYDDVDLFDTWGFLRRALEARPEVCDAIDGVALHPYTWFQQDPPEHDEWVSDGVEKRGQEAQVALARRMLAEAGCAPKAISFTEVGWPTYDLTAAEVARFAVRSALLAALDGIDGWFWYTFWDDAPDASGIRPHENFFGLWEWPGEGGLVRRPKPAWEALSVLLDRLGDLGLVRDLGPDLGLPPDVHVLVFADGRGRVALAMWDGREMPDVTSEGTAEGGPDTAYDVSLDLPAGATDMHFFGPDGVEGALPVCGLTLLPRLTPSVQYFEFRLPDAPP
ncbi:MAG TPA: hypothetical protein PLQ97_11855 [Myxococcota bacterium]|nr:hypothetical protein [Myxococcota bacterium]HQK51454.1 hypothetical protein [Myxococcota bacterium]